MSPSPGNESSAKTDLYPSAMLLDSNIIIYASKPAHTKLRQFIAETVPAVSAVSYVEVLGYHRLTQEEKNLLEAFFSAAHVLAISDQVLEQAVLLRQQKKMTLGDALIAATAITYELTLVTHNTQDFEWIAGLSLLDPLSD